MALQMHIGLWNSVCERPKKQRKQRGVWMEVEFKSQCILTRETSCWHSGSASQRAWASDALKGSDNKHRTGGSEAGQAAEICHRTRCSTASWVNTETGLFVFGRMGCKQRLMENLMDSNAPLSGAVLGKTIEDGKLQLKSVCYREGHEFQMT